MSQTRRGPVGSCFSTGAAACGAMVLIGLGCGGQQAQQAEHMGWATPASQPITRVKDDRSRCEYRGRADREAVETAGPGSLQPNVRRVYQIVGSGDTMHKVLMCREIDSNLDGVKDIVRTYNEKGESLHEEADTNYDNKVDIWTTFSSGRLGREELDSNFDGKPDVWKYYVGGRLSRIQRDTSGDGRPDQWEFYTSGKLERIGIDVDFDGHVDRWDRDQAMKLAEETGESPQGQGQNGSSSAQSSGARPSSSQVASDGGTPLTKGVQPQKP